MSLDRMDRWVFNYARIAVEQEIEGLEKMEKNLKPSAYTSNAKSLCQQLLEHINKRLQEK